MQCRIICINITIAYKLINVCVVSSKYLGRNVRFLAARTTHFRLCDSVYTRPLILWFTIMGYMIINMLLKQTFSKMMVNLYCIQSDNHTFIGCNVKTTNISAKQDGLWQNVTLRLNNEAVCVCMIEHQGPIALWIIIKMNWWKRYWSNLQKSTRKER